MTVPTSLALELEGLLKGPRKFEWINKPTWSPTSHEMNSASQFIAIYVKPTSKRWI